MKFDSKLYLVTDRTMLKNMDLKQAVKLAILGGVTMVQLREKDISSLEFYNIALDIKKITDSFNIPLIINDRIDIALAVDASGVHVGQSDMPAHIARKLIGKDKILGISAATIETAKAAELAGADYIGVGAIYDTTSKDDAKRIHVSDLKIIKEAVSIPVVAIGGINKNNLPPLMEANIDGIAVISAILASDDIENAAKELISIFPSK